MRTVKEHTLKDHDQLKLDQFSTELKDLKKTLKRLEVTDLLSSFSSPVPIPGDYRSGMSNTLYRTYATTEYDPWSDLYGNDRDTWDYIDWTGHFKPAHSVPEYLFAFADPNFPPAKPRAADLYLPCPEFLRDYPYNNLRESDYISLSSFIIPKWYEFDRDLAFEELTRTSEALMLLDTDDLAVRNVSRVIHGHLESYTATLDEEHLFAAALTVYQLERDTQIRKKNCADNIRYLIRKRFHRFRRDLRQCYRFLIRFLFKNMDADTDDSRILSNRTLNQNSLFITQHHIYGTARHNPVLKRTG